MELVELHVPSGVGGGMALALRVDGVTTNAVAFAYAPPSLHGVVPAVADATGDELTLAGANFGVDAPGAAGLDEAQAADVQALSEVLAQQVQVAQS